MSPISFLNFVVSALSLFVSSQLWPIMLVIFALGLLSVLIYIIFRLVEIR